MANNLDMNLADNEESNDIDTEQELVDQEANQLVEEVAPPKLTAQPEAQQPAQQPQPINAAEQVVDGLVQQGKVSPELAAKIKDQMASRMADHVINEQEKQDVIQSQTQARMPAQKNIQPTKVAAPTASKPAQPSAADKFVKPGALAAQEQEKASGAGMGEAESKLESGVQKQIAGLAAQGQAGAEQAKAEEQTYAEKLKALDDHQKRVDNLRLQADKVFESKVQSAQKIQDSLLKDKIDPERYWRNLPTGNKIGVAIGLILSGFGGTASAKNAVGILENSIQRDIDAQKENIQNKQAGLKGQMSLLELYRQKFQDDRQAESQYMVTTMEMAKAKLEQVASKYKSAAVQAQALQAIGQIEERQAEELMKMREIELKNQAKIAQPTRYGTAGDIDVNKLSNDEREAYVGGIGIASNKDAAKRLREMAGELLPAEVGVSKLLELGEKGNRLSLKDRAQISTRLTAIAGKLRIPFTGPGVLQEGEFKRLMEALGNPNKLIALKDVQLEHLRTVQKILKENIEEEKTLAGIKTQQNIKSFKPSDKK